MHDRVDDVFADPRDAHDARRVERLPDDEGDEERTIEAVDHAKRGASVAEDSAGVGEARARGRGGVGHAWSGA
ncbi:hypothetical protein LBMAG42_29560 [Deltaproteobacteria bacterium]|nr:hypothetical protein LBMAG42_29560 [Deltaproteobacteria bacterium]